MLGNTLVNSGNSMESRHGCSNIDLILTDKNGFSRYEISNQILDLPVPVFVLVNHQRNIM